jgi:hypothetical protein
MFRILKFWKLNIVEIIQIWKILILFLKKKIETHKEKRKAKTWKYKKETKKNQLDHTNNKNLNIEVLEPSYRKNQRHVYIWVGPLNVRRSCDGEVEGFRSIVNQKISYGCEQESQDLI